MGSLMLPTSGSVYLDTMAFIYTVERYPDYWPLLEPLWLAAQAGMEMPKKVSNARPEK